MPDPVSPPENEPPKDKKQEATFMSGILDWLGTVITDAARADSVDPITHAHEISLITERQSKVAQSAKMIADDLKEVKTRLIEEFGPGAASFIAKCIDPMISHLTTLIEDLAASNRLSGSFDEFLNYAIERVKYYSGLDEKKLKIQIVLNAHGLVEQAIQKDIDVLSNYKIHMLEGKHAQEGIAKLEHMLQPIIRELQTMAATRLETDNLRQFFRWKQNVDEKRNILIEMGLFVIDSFAKDKSSSDNKETKFEDYALALNALLILESRLQQLFDILEKSPQLDGHTVSIVEKNLSELQDEANHFVALHEDNIQIQKGFKSVCRGIKRSSTLLDAHKKNLKSTES